MQLTLKHYNKSSAPRKMFLVGFLGHRTPQRVAKESEKQHID
jgi:hypothetical protein